MRERYNWIWRPLGTGGCILLQGIQAPERVAGRKDNVDIVSWLLTDYHMETGNTLPEITGENGKTVECLDRREHEGEWAVLTR